MSVDDNVLCYRIRIPAVDRYSARLLLLEAVLNIVPLLVVLIIRRYNINIRLYSHLYYIIYILSNCSLIPEKSASGRFEKHS